MQNKVFVKVFAVLLALVCIYYLSFSFVTSHYESKAAKMSPEAGQRYLDSMKNESVWMFKTLRECQEYQLGLGLDLKGGMNVTLEVSVPDIIKALAADNAEDPTFVKAFEKASQEANESQDDFITLFVDAYQSVAGKDKMSSVFATRQMGEKINARSTDAQIEKVLRSEVKDAIDNSYNVLRSRIDRFGVAQPNIQKLEGAMGRIMVEMPGVKEPERVRKLLQTSANLEFWETYSFNEIWPEIQALDAKLVGGETTEAADTTAAAETTEATAEPAADSAKTSIIEAKLKANTTAKSSVADNAAAVAANKKAHPLLSLIMPAQNGREGSAIIGYVVSYDTAEVNKLLNSPEAKSTLRPDVSLKWGVKPSELFPKAEVFELFAIRVPADGKAPLEGNAVTDARADFDQNGRPEVSMSMNNDGARIWANITKNNIGKAVAIVLDGVVYSAPNVMNEINGGNSQITGNFTTEDTKDLSNVLKGGKMDAPVKIVQDDTVGPSLGQESINKGIMSCIVAFVLLMIYMCMLYGLRPGMVANSALIVNFFFILGVLASFQAALTMSGIAGMVLTLGMAVDANVLIYERTKEELRAGKKIKSAIADGYGNAFSAIIDSNVTSIITGIILFYFGTGPIRGFATTLIVGLLASMFTAVWLTRIVFEHFVNKDKWQNLTFTTGFSKNFMQNKAYKFMSAYKVSFIVWAVALVVCFASYGVRGLSSGIDFTGGRNYTVQFDKQVVPENVKAAILPNVDGANVSVLALGTNGKTVRVSTNYKIDSNDPSVDGEIESILYKSLSEGKFLADGVSFETFKDRDNQAGGSIISSQKVGPSVAKDVTYGAIRAVIFALIAIFLYIFVRFRNIAFSVGSTVGLICDSLLIIGTYSLLWGVMPFSLEVDQTFIAAVLTCIGYSINDKVVIFDRIREFIKLYPKHDRQELFNRSLNTTLARTINTSTTTLLVLLCIFFLGGDSIRSFSFAMILGVIYGTCSSIFISAPMAYLVLGRKIKKEEEVAK
ncbi:MAG: protein translocase subunit SecDF [Bacteroidaceae bacterium]|nr:protein translocase subunit SecDF [Bacteroidaceae bacterium]